MATYGSITVDGSLGDWNPVDRIDVGASAVAGYKIYGKVVGGALVVAIETDGTAIGDNSTFWLNTDLNTATGYQVFGFAGGAEYNVNLSGGVLKLYTGAAGDIEQVGVAIDFSFGAGGSVLEFALPLSALGGATSADLLADVNEAVYLPGDYSQAGYLVDADPAPVVYGDITLDGSIGEWSALDRLDAGDVGAGNALYGKAAGDSFVFAVQSATPFTAGTTIWLNTDDNASTGYQIFGFAGGAEYNINFDANGVAHLYTGAAGDQAVVGGENLIYRYSADMKTVEIAVQKTLIGSPAKIGVLADINDSTFAPGDYSGPQYEVTDTSLLPPRTDMSKHVAIVYSDTTAALYFGSADAQVNLTGYSQLFMAVQNQAMAAGIPFTVIHESDLKDISKLVNFDTIVFPSFRDVNTADYTQIHDTLKLAVEQYHIGLISAGDFMTNDQTGAVLPGDPYAAMKEFFDITRATGGTDTVDLKAGDLSSPIMQGYSAGELIRHYDGSYPTPPGDPASGTPGVGWQAFTDATPGSGAAHTVIDTQTVNGVTYDAAIAETTAQGGRNVHFATDSFLADNNQLQHAITWSVEGAGVTVGLQLSRSTSVFAARNDMDQAQQQEDARPVDDNGVPLPGGGIEDHLLQVVTQWKTLYNFVGSFYATIGDGVHAGENTDWSYAGPLYAQFAALGNEIGSHSLTHLSHLTPAEDTNFLTVGSINSPGTFAYEFEKSRDILNANLPAYIPGYVDSGAAVPGMPEKLATSLNILQYYSYMTGGYSGVGAGYPGAIGFLTPDSSKVYIAPNMKFDFTLVDFLKMTPAAALAEWNNELADLSNHADVPVIVFPWHDYSGTQWVTPGDTTPSPYTSAMFNDFIAAVAASGAEFVTLDDLAKRVTSFDASKITYTTSGNVITATVNSTDAGKFALDLDNLGSQHIVSVAGWYAYDDDSVFLPKNGGTYAINLGTTAPTDVTHIITLPMRAELVSLTGDGKNLDFTINGEGKLTVDLQDPTGRTYAVTGATVVSLTGDKLVLDLGAIGSHNVHVGLNATPVITSDGGGATGAISLAENIVAVTTVTATDADTSDTLTYSISGGADAALFAINATTGALTFITAPNFEIPTDAGANNVYDVVVRASDGIGFDDQALAVTITNVNEAPVITSNGGLATAAVSIAEWLTAATTVVGADPDASTVLAYSIVGGADAALFAIDATTGALSFIKAPNFDAPTDAGANNVYDVTVRASDGTLFADQALAFTILDLPGIHWVGTTGNDTVTGTEFADTFDGLDGNDTIHAGAGDDILVGGAGNDVLFGEAGNDTMTGGTGDDIYVVTEAADVVTEAVNEGNDEVVAYFNYALGANVEMLALGGTGDFSATGNELANNIWGNSGANLIHGGAGNDLIYGGGGADIIYGDAGNDTMLGEAGDDIYVVTEVGDVVTEAANQGNDEVVAYFNYTLGANVEMLALGGTGNFSATGNELANNIWGNSGANLIHGGAGNDLVYGGGGADIIYGDAGNDTMIGEAGDDIYVVTEAGDVVIEVANEGNDEVVAYFNYTLGANVEMLALGGTGNFSATGNELANNIWGNSGANLIHGGAGNDLIYGGGGADTIYGDAGNDTMLGEAGDDIYVVTETGDVVTEAANQGNDEVVAYFSYTLGANLEMLALGGTGDFSATGNELANNIWGNSGANLIHGGAGNDVIYGGAGADTIYGDAGNDTMLGEAGNDIYVVTEAGDVVIEAANEGNDEVVAYFNYALGANVEMLALGGTGDFSATGNEFANNIWGNSGANLIHGGAGNDVIYGGAGNDTIYGDAGNDTMSGEAGNDIYVVTEAGDVVIEAANEGTDQVVSYLSYTLGANVEYLALGGTGNFSATGNSLNNTIWGNSGANVIDGGAGNDVLYGGVGNDTMLGGAGNDMFYGEGGADTMTGGAGNDSFVFAAGQAAGDVVTDFAGNGSSAGDMLYFTGFGTAAQGASFTSLGGNQWQIHSGLDGHNEIITLSGGAAIHPSDYIFG